MASPPCHVRNGAISRCEQSQHSGLPSRRPLAALDQSQKQGARIADARVLTRRVGLHPVRLLALPLGQLLQELLKHLGRVVLTTRRSFVFAAHSLKCPLDDAAAHAVEFANFQLTSVIRNSVGHLQFTRCFFR
jgi:hypothetical protein